MASAPHGTGIIWAQSRISTEAKDVLDENTFLTWYDEEHIADVVATSAVQSGFRYLDANKTSPCGNEGNHMPFLALYPVPDLSFMLGDEFKKIRVQSDKLPGSGVVFDSVDFEISSLGILDKTERKKTIGGYIW